MSQRDGFTPNPDTDELHAAVEYLMTGMDYADISNLDTLRQLRAGPPYTISDESTVTAEQRAIRGPGGTQLELRIFRPAGRAKAVMVDIHGGGWSLGAASDNDWLNRQFASRCGVATVSVDYRLAPEWPFPAAADDCLAATQWVASKSADEFGTSSLLFHGMSAGAHLSVVTLLRLREQEPEILDRVRGLSLEYGCYDITRTPSHRSADARTPILPDHWLRAFIYHAFSEYPDRQRQEAAVSPLYADLRGLPPALFTVGDLDPLLDDSLFMAARWQAAGSHADLDVWHRGIHGISNLALTPHTAQAVLQRTCSWFHDRLGEETNIPVPGSQG